MSFGLGISLGRIYRKEALKAELEKKKKEGTKPWKLIKEIIYKSGWLYQEWEDTSRPKETVMWEGEDGRKIVMSNIHKSWFNLAAVQVKSDNIFAKIIRFFKRRKHDSSMVLPVKS